jgi:phenylacetate-CoA ligase
MTTPSPADGLARLIRHLDASERLDAAEIRSLQFRRLGRVAEYCHAHSPSFATRLASVGLAPRDLEHPAGLESLPVLTRRAIQTAGTSLFCDEVPSTHEPIRETHSSGSTGEPVIVRRTALTEFVRMALTMRDHTWHGRDLGARLCTVRGNVSSYTPYPDWGLPTSLFGTTGPMLSLPLVTDTTTLAAWIKEFDPTYLLLLPTTLRALAAYYRRHDWRLPSLREIRTFGEMVHPSTRDEVASTFGVAIVDCYSSSEVGYIALTCPISGQYHVMSESVIAEVLDDQGHACAPGQIGRVVLTDLHNFATPLVRYDIGDYAEVDEPCRCGRGLPTWRRILGRQRNMVVKPDGSRHWPVTGFYRCRDVAPIVQYQVIQHDRGSFEARLVVERDLTAAEEDTLRDHFAACMGDGLSLRFTYVADRQPVGAGKFEEFICRVPGSENLEAGPSHDLMRT